MREQTIVTISFFLFYFVTPSTIFHVKIPFKEKCEGCSFFHGEKLFFRQERTISGEYDDIMNKEEKNIVETFFIGIGFCGLVNVIIYVSLDVQL